MPSPRSCAQPAVISLLDKYSTLHSNIDKTREELAKHELEFQKAKERVNRLWKERERMTTETQHAAEEKEKYAFETSKALQDLTELEQDYIVAMSKRANAKNRLEATKVRADAYRQSFLEKSRDFRSTCKRLCVREEQLGLENVSLQVYAKVKCLAVIDAELTETAEEEHRNNERDDKELKEAEERLQIREEAHSKARSAQEKLLAKKMILLETQKKRQSQKQQLQSQLIRIRKDFRYALRQISDLQQQTKESQDLARNFENDAKCRRERAAAKQRPLQNPYMKNKVVSKPAANTSAASRDEARHLPQEEIPSSPRPVSDTQQHPHRTGRVRPQRGFGLSLRLSDTVNNSIPNSYDTSVDEQVSASKANCNAPPRVSEPSRITPSIPIDDDDDDDDEDEALLQFVAFASKN